LELVSVANGGVGWKICSFRDLRASRLLSELFLFVIVMGGQMASE